jgi:hypothetical protein
VIKWQIHGSNVPQSVNGQLTLVVPEPKPADRRITRMDELIEPDGDDD